MFVKENPDRKKRNMIEVWTKFLNQNRVIPAGIYLFKVNYRNTRQYVKSVQN